MNLYQIIKMIKTMRLTRFKLNRKKRLKMSQIKKLLRTKMIHKTTMISMIGKLVKRRSLGPLLMRAWSFLIILRSRVSHASFLSKQDH